MVQHGQKINENEYVLDSVEESIVSLEDVSGNGRGTGFVTLTGTGKRVIVTNAHVCEINPTLPLFSVFHRSGELSRKELKFPAIVLKVDDEHDLCIVSAPADLDVRPITVANDQFRDEKVYIYGYPIVQLLSSSEGYVRGYQLVDNIYDKPIDKCVGKKFHVETISVEQEDGSIREQQQCFLRAFFVFTDATSDHGASGSPALNGDGEVVGVMSMINGQAKPFGFLVPLIDLRRFLSLD